MSTLNKPRRGQELGFVSTSTSLVFGTELFLHFLDDIDSSIAALEGSIGNSIIITELADFPLPVGGVITLEVNKVYIISGNIDIGSNVIVFAFNSVMEGFGALISSITTSSGSPLLSGIVNARVLTLFAAQPIAAISEKLVLRFVSFSGVTANSIFIQDSPEVVIDNVLTTDGTTGISINGANGFIRISGSELKDFTSAGIDLGTSGFSLLFIDGVIFTSALGFGIAGLANSGNVIIGASVSGSAFVGGLTPLGNITKEDLKWDFKNNIGIEDSRIVGAMELVINVNTTTLIDNIPVQLAGNFVLSPPNERFVLTSNELEALVDGQGLVSISMDGGATSGGGSDNYDIVLLQNGTPDTVFRAVSVDTSAGSIGLEVPISWVAGDSFSIAVTRRSGTRNWITANATLFIR